ncbi:hypothetical protein AUJ46_06365 [Candidatus Peregrinibacteria bacterium CG1_02_54_53]|nr:MAG: hypothetical protein AUJ46_06365 [Candidatus Peregrinibacteria bacterium CG1_02_54_53]
MLDTGHGQWLVAEAAQSYLKESLPERIEGVISGYVEFKSIADERRCLWILLNIPRPWIIDIPDGSE